MKNLFLKKNKNNQNQNSNQNNPNSKPKKDFIFIGTLGLILVNLVYFFAGAVSGVVTTGHWWAGLWVFVDGIAIIATLYLIRNYTRKRKAEKLEYERKQKEKSNNEFSDGSV
jgi:hypothetical protein